MSMIFVVPRLIGVDELRFPGGPANRHEITFTKHNQRLKIPAD